MMNRMDDGPFGAHPDPDAAGLARDPLPLRGRVAVVTGASRREGIGYAVARRLAAYGASVLCHHHVPHDARQPWGQDDIGAVVQGVRDVAAPGARVEDYGADLADPDAPRRLMAAAVERWGHVDVLVANHARSGGDGRLSEVDAAMLDAHWAVDTRSVLLLAKEFAAQHDGREGGRLVFMTSGQGEGPMVLEVAYAAAKGALAAITATIAADLADAGVRVNTVNPGPVQTGYLTEEDARAMRPMFPFGRWGVPDDPARLIAWLCTDEGRWITGQVIASEGGFARWRAPDDRGHGR